MEIEELTNKPMQQPDNLKILIVRLGALGDILHAIPAQQHLASQLPNASIHWVAESGYAPLLECVPGIDRIWRANTKSWRRNPSRFNELYGLVRRLRKEKFDIAFDFQGLMKSALLARVSGAARIFGFRPERFKENGTQWFYDECLEGESDLRRHVIEMNLRLVGRLVPASDILAVVPFRIPSEAQAYIDAKLASFGVERPVLVNPGAGWTTKLWPTESYALLSSRIQRELGVPVVVTYGPGEEVLVERMKSAVSPEALVSFPTTIVELLALCRRSRLMIAGDSGPLHLAVAAGTPTVAILGPTSAGRNGPFCPEDEVVQRKLPCSDSYKRVCNEFICMDIPGEAVFEVVRNRLGKISHPEVIAETQATRTP